MRAKREEEKNHQRELKERRVQQRGGEKKRATILIRGKGNLATKGKAKTVLLERGLCLGFVCGFQFYREKGWKVSRNRRNITREIKRHKGRG